MSIAGLSLITTEYPLYFIYCDADVDELNDHLEDYKGKHVFVNIGNLSDKGKNTLYKIVQNMRRIKLQFTLVNYNGNRLDKLFRDLL